MAYTTVAIIYNPNSTGASEQLARELADEIHTRVPRQKVELFKTEHAGHGEELAYDIAISSERPLIISSSGDGGYYDVINGAMKAQREGRQPTTGILPAGNANDHYHNLHTDDLAEQIVKQQSMKIDLLKIASTTNGKPIERYAHSYIGFGLTPQVGQELTKAKLNPVTEAWIVLKSLWTIKPVHLKIDEKVRHYESVVCSNVDIMSKFLKISQPSSVTDGRFEVTIFTRRNKLRLLLLLLEASLKGVKEDTQVSEFTLTTVHETLVQADGEIIKLDADAEVRVTVEPRILTCIV